MTGSLSAADPFYLQDGGLAVVHPFQDTGKRTLVPTPLSFGTNKILLCAGQSTMAAYAPTPFVPTSPNVHNFNIYDGACYQLADPPLSTTYEAARSGSIVGRIGDKIIAAGKASRVILVPIAIGASSVSQWVSDPAIAPRIGVTAARLKAAGLLSSVSAICWQQGEADNLYGTTQAAYTASFATVLAAFRAAGFTCPILVAETSMIYGATSAAVRAAQAAAVNPAQQILAGPDTDTIPVASRQSDQTHFTDAGADTCAGLWVNALSTAGVI